MEVSRGDGFGLVILYNKSQPHTMPRSALKVSGGVWWWWSVLVGGVGGLGIPASRVIYFCDGSEKFITPEYFS